jgi:hypothetical protein
MKKISLLTLVVFVLVVSVASATYQTGTVTLTGNDADLDIDLSNNVSLDYAAVADDGLGYALVTYHSSGTRTYGSSSGDSGVFWQDNTAVAAPTAPSGTASADFGSWTEM